jgi:Ca-activated chloride channel family protein
MRADFALDYDVMTVERPQNLYLMARFVAGTAPNERNRRPLNLSLVIDRSGSMAGLKMDYTRQAAQFLVQHLGNQDTFSIVLYNDKVETLVTPDILVNKDNIINLIEGIRVRGTTNLSGGWLEGCQHVKNGMGTNHLNRVILMSDGLANRGITDTAQLVTLAKQKYGEGVSTTTMGLGNDFNEDLMMEMANAGGGAFYFIESPEVAPEIFKEELTGLLSVVGQNLTITVTPNEHVKNVRQMNAYPMQTNGKVTSFRLGDIFGGELKTMIIELNIPALHTLGEQQIATLTFEYDEIVGESTAHRVYEMPVMIKIRAAHELPPPPDSTVAQSVLLLQAAQARKEAIKSADAGDFLGASQLLRTVATAIEQSAVKNNQLQEERDALVEQAEQLSRGAQTYNEYNRKTMSTQAFYTQTNRHDDTVMLRYREIQRNMGDAKSEKIETHEEIPTVAEPLSHDNVDYQPGIEPTHVTWRGQTFALNRDVTRIGRAVHNEVVIDEKGISRFHAQIKRHEDVLVIEDLNSTNGTMVGGERITEPHPLSVGDVVYICDEKLLFSLSPQ